MANYVKVPVVYQMEATECGAASLSMIFAYFGKHMALEKMRVETGVSRDGCKASNIMRTAKRYGLNCRAYTKEPESLVKTQMPCIIHWRFNHFIVLEGFRNGYVYLNDPAVGKRKLTMEEFSDGFTGIVLTFERTSAFKKEKKKNTMWRFILERLKGQYAVIFKLFYIGLLLVFPGIVLPILSQVFMDDILGNGYTDWLTKLLVFMGLAAVMKVSLTYYRYCLLQKLQNKMSILSGYGFLQHLFRLPIFFFDQRYAGDISSRVEDNTEVSKFLAGDLGETVLHLLVAVFYLVVLLLYSPQLTLVGLGCVAINIGIMLYSAKRIGDSAMKLEMDSGKLSGVVYAGIGISSTLKAAGAEHAYSTRIISHQAKVSSQEQAINRIQQVLDAIPNAVSQIADVMILLVGGLMVMRGRFTIGMLVAFSSLFGSFSDPVEELIGFVKKIKILKTNMCRVEDIMLYQQDETYNTERPLAPIKTKLAGDVRLDRISFGYSPYKEPLIEDFSLSIKSGHSVAIVGPSGCGKSTISKLISGLYQPWSGGISFDGFDAAEVPAEVRNVSVSTVSQSIVLFAGTIRDNLTFWNPAILESDMIAAAKDACIHDVIIQKGGYDYRLTEAASNMSGGQQQRLEIARALATNPSILILDEATSALDPIVEKQVIDNIRRRGCTCIVVAHRLSAIRDCDEIIMMQRGRIVQRGRHDEMAHSDGFYKTFVQNI